MKRFAPLLALCLLLGSLAGAAGADTEDDDKKKPKPPPLTLQEPLEEAPDPEPVNDSPPILIRGAKVLTAAGESYESGYLLMGRGRILAVGEGPGEPPHGAEIIDAQGKYLTPGIIDTHSHIGVHPAPKAKANDDGNEDNSPVTAGVWAEHSFWPQDPDIWRAVAGGVTTIQVLPGSANLIGGRSFTAKLKSAASAREMRFPGARQGLKMACGENPKKVHQNKGPSTRMGNVYGYRKAFQNAREYGRKLEKYARDLAFWKERVEKAAKNEKELRKIGDPPEEPDRKFDDETLYLALKGVIDVHSHCYRADEMSIMMDLSEEYGFAIRSFHHALESYKIRRRLAKRKIASSTWADWWGSKMEAFDGIPQNAAMLEDAGAVAIIHSDSARELRHLNQEAAKALTAGRKVGLDAGIDKALAWITKNPAWALGVEDLTGTLEAGKMADVVLWDRHPFSVYARAEKVYIDGRKVFDRADGTFGTSDFEIGIRPEGLADGRDFSPAPVTFPGRDVPDGAKRPGKRLPGDSYDLENVRVLVGDGTTLARATVQVRDGRIARIIDGASEAPTELPRIDGSGKTLTPGLFETLSQLGLYEVGAEKSTVDHTYEGHSVSPAFRASDAFNPASVRIPIAREEGVTTALVSPGGDLLYGTGCVIDLDEKPEDGLWARAAMFGGVGAHAAKSLGESRGGVWLRLRQIIDDARFYRSNRRDVDRGRARELSLAPIHLEALLPVLRGEIPLVLRASRESDIRAALRFKREVEAQGDKLRLVIAGGHEAWTAAKELAAAGVPVILTPSDQRPGDFERLRAVADAAARLHGAGVKLILSSDGNPKRLRQEAGIAVAYGLDHSAALTAVTAAPAEVFATLDAGLVAEGRRANLVLWSGDPFETHTIVERLWVDGKDISLDTRQLELSRRYLKK